jgi:ribosome biogenesis ATPase
MDEKAESGNEGKITISTVYDSIAHSNSSLKRRSKKLLENSIERVILVLREERDDSESVEGDFDGIEESAPVVKVCLFAVLRS